MASKRRMASKLERRSPLSRSGVEIFAAIRKVSGNEIIPRTRNRVDISSSPQISHTHTNKKRNDVFTTLGKSLGGDYVKEVRTPFPSIDNDIQF